MRRLTAKNCPECGEVRSMPHFTPRIDVYGEGKTPSLEDIWWQSRCRDCLSLYHKRRRLCQGRILPLGKALKLRISVEKGSVFRRLHVDGKPPSNALRLVRQLVKEFNDELSVDHSSIETHGITLMTPTKDEPEFQQIDITLIRTS